MTAQSAHVDVDHAIGEEYRKPENAFDQVANILLGLFRFATTLWVHAVAMTGVLVLFLLCVTPQTLTPLWATAFDSDDPGSVLYQQPVYQDAAPLPSSEPEAEADASTYLAIEEEDRPLSQSPRPLDAAPMSLADAQLHAKQSALQEAPIPPQTALQPAWSNRVQAREEALSVLKNVLRIATFCAFFVGVVCNTGRFTWVYRERALARVQAAQRRREQMELCRQAAASVLAQQRESALNNGQEAA